MNAVATARPDTLRARLRVPLVVFGVLMACLALNMTLAFLKPFAAAGYVEMAIAAGMAATVLLFSMEITHQSPLIRLFSVIGFFWVGILFALTLMDFLTR